MTLLALSAASCSAISTVVGRVTGSTKAEEAKVELAEAQHRVMRFADSYASAVIQAATRIQATSPEKRLAVIGWQLRQGTAIFAIATGPYPVTNAIDMVVLVALSRSVAERYWVPEVFGDSGSPLLEALQSFEPKAWELLDGILKPDGEKGMHALIDGWIAQNPEVHDVAFTRVLDLVQASSEEGFQGLGTTSDVLSAFGLDLFGKLDPAVRQVEEARILSEKALYFAQRWPLLLDLQVQQLALELSLQPAAQRVLGDAGRVARSADALAGVAAGLPDLVAREREAAIRQLMDEIEAQGSRAREALAQLKGTLEAGTATATSVEGAIRSLDAFVSTVRQPPLPGSPPSKPFEVDAYTRALEQFGKTAGELQALVASLDRDAPRVEALVGRTARQASEEGRALVDHLMWRALALVTALLAGLLVVALAYRWGAARINARAAAAKGGS